MSFETIRRQVANGDYDHPEVERRVIDGLIADMNEGGHAVGTGERAGRIAPVDTRHAREVIAIREDAEAVEAETDNALFWIGFYAIGVVLLIGGVAWMLWQ